MHSRKIRVTAAGVLARLGPGGGELINVSLSGALLRLDREVDVDAVWPLEMSDLEIRCRVVRCLMESAGDPPRWLVAVVFTDLSARDARALRELVAEMYERVETSRV
jgi:hypothetical protein